MWHLTFAAKAANGFRRLDPPVQRQIKRYMSQVCALEDPSIRGKALTGDLVGLWRYRVGDYRLVCEIIRGELTIIALDIDHRSAIYR